jgi:hypothetical protein
MDTLFTFMVNMITQLEKQLVCAQAKIQELSKANKNRDSYEYYLDDFETQVEKQKDLLKECQVQLVDCQVQLFDQDEDIEELEIQIENQKILIGDLETQVDDSQDQISKQEKEIEKLEGQLHVIRTRAKEQENQIENLKMHIGDLENQLDNDYHQVDFQARVQECQTSPIEKILFDTFAAQYKNGLKLLFIYKQLQITGRFRYDSWPVAINNSNNWQLCLKITTKPQFDKLVESYNAKLDDIGFSEAVDVIKNAGIETDRYVGDYSTELVENVLDQMHGMENYPASHASYMNVVTRKFIKHEPKNEKNFTWHKVCSYSFAIPRECDWGTGDVLKMFKYHIDPK